MQNFQHGAQGLGDTGARDQVIVYVLIHPWGRQVIVQRVFLHAHDDQAVVSAGALHPALRQGRHIKLQPSVLAHQALADRLFPGPVDLRAVGSRLLPGSALRSLEPGRPLFRPLAQQGVDLAQQEPRPLARGHIQAQVRREDLMVRRDAAQVGAQQGDLVVARADAQCLRRAMALALVPTIQIGIGGQFQPLWSGDGRRRGAGRGGRVVRRGAPRWARPASRARAWAGACAWGSACRRAWASASPARSSARSPPPCGSPRRHRARTRCGNQIYCCRRCCSGRHRSTSQV